MNNTDINKAILRYFYGKDIVFSEDDRSFASSESYLRYAAENNFYGAEGITKNGMGDFCFPLRDYAGEIVQAWALAKLMAEKTQFYVGNDYYYKVWYANFKDKSDEWISADADTAPLAVSKVFLKFIEEYND